MVIVIKKIEKRCIGVDRIGYSSIYRLELVYRGRIGYIGNSYPLLLQYLYDSLLKHHHCRRHEFLPYEQLRIVIELGPGVLRIAVQDVFVRVVKKYHAVYQCDRCCGTCINHVVICAFAINSFSNIQGPDSGTCTDWECISNVDLGYHGTCEILCTLTRRLLLCINEHFIEKYKRTSNLLDSCFITFIEIKILPQSQRILISSLWNLVNFRLE
ncbi:hypothetical protein BDA99DRAFT_533485 [Phascolomyces articulosus]|uniref:Uncharacterized protein n=1 Tax=Phascolomyces articulosus TaxID=60185 RepID=A0AAD5KJ15_9FUNG|nr:hypothetical protein BDA99DRAFT_533485 [Phascolomyces articulosus]